MAVTVRQLAELVGGIVVGDADLLIQSASTLQDAQPDDITFLDHARNVLNLEKSDVRAAIVPANLQSDGKTVIQVADPLMAFAAVVQFLKGKPPTLPMGIDPRAAIHPTARLGADSIVEPFASIGENTIIGARCRLHPGVRVGNNCVLGDDVVLFPNVVLYDNTQVGDRVTIHANSCIGADGFGYRFQQGRHVKVPQLGNVVVGSDVEIGAGTTIDRATFGSTRIGAGTKIDNLVQIAHNCQIGKHNVIAAQVGIAGSCTTGSYVMIGGQAGVKDHIHIGDGARIGAKTGIIHDVPPGQSMFWYPAHEDREAARILACIKKLPAMRKDLVRILKALHLPEGEEMRLTPTPETPAA